MTTDVYGPMGSAGPDRGCGQPMDSPDAISPDLVIPPTYPATTLTLACPQPPHNPFGELRNPILTAFSPHRISQPPTSRAEHPGALPHSPSALLNYYGRAALPTGLIIARNESGNRKRKTDPVNHTPA